MQNLSGLLERFAKSLLGDSQARETVVNCVKEALKFDLEPQNISIKGEVLEIRTSSIKQNEIKLHEESLIAEINTKSGLKIKRILYL